jgi:hypothetical protein
MITERVAYQNRAFPLGIDFILPNGAGAFPMASTYAVNLFRHNNVVAFATGTVANGKLSLVATAPKTALTCNFLVADMQGIDGYGSAEILDTVANKVITVVPLRFVKEGTPNTLEFGERLVIYQETVVCVVDGYAPPASGGGGGSVAGSTIFKASGVAGTNAITAATNGMAAPSATPQYLDFTPALDSTAAVSITLDAFGALSVKSPWGNALDADNKFKAAIPYLLRVTSTDIRIISPW